MKLNLSNPATGQQKCIEIDDDRRIRPLLELRMASEIEGELLGDEFAGYRLKIMGGNDKQGFPMKQGVLTATRVRLLMKKGVSCYRQRCRGERKRKSVRGCIVGSDLAVLNLVVEKKGPAELEGLTDTQVAKRLGPKRANNIRKVFSLEKADDVRGYVDLFRRKFVGKNGKDVNKAPKIQRLVTPVMVQRKHRLFNKKLKARVHAKQEAAAYSRLASKRAAEAKVTRQSEIAKRRSSRKSSKKVA